MSGRTVTMSDVVALRVRYVTVSEERIYAVSGRTFTMSRHIGTAVDVRALRMDMLTLHRLLNTDDRVPVNS